MILCSLSKSAGGSFKKDPLGYTLHFTKKNGRAKDDLPGKLIAIFPINLFYISFGPRDFAQRGRSQRFLPQGEGKRGQLSQLAFRGQRCQELNSLSGLELPKPSEEGDPQ